MNIISIQYIIQYHSKVQGQVYKVHFLHENMKMRGSPLRLLEVSISHLTTPLGSCLDSYV